jgi:hypothetical protein
MKGPRFHPGRLVITPGALAAIPQPELLHALTRHLQGDWGECCPEDRAANDTALAIGERLLSVYTTADQVRFWIITERDRSATTFLLPEEY